MLPLKKKIMCILSGERIKNCARGIYYCCTKNLLNHTVKRMSVQQEAMREFGKYRMKKTDKKDRRCQRLSFLIGSVSRKRFEARRM